MLSKDDIKKRVSHMVTQKISDKKIVVWGLGPNSRDLIIELKAKGIEVFALIILKSQKTENKLWGICTYTPGEFSRLFNHNMLLFITKEEYRRYKYVIDIKMHWPMEDIFKDYGSGSFLRIKGRIFFKRFGAICKKYYGYMKKCFSAVRITLSYIEGLRIYNRIRKKFGNDVQLLYANYPGTGDIILLNTMLKDFLEKEQISDYVMITIGTGCRKMAEICGWKNIYQISPKESDSLSKYMRFTGEKTLNIKHMIQIANHEDIALKFAGERLNLFEMYLYQICNFSVKPELACPEFVYNRDKINKMFSDNGLTPGKTVVLSPYAYSEVGFGKKFWEKLANRLLREGYKVCTMCHGIEQKVKNTVPIDFSYEDSACFLETAGFFIGMRSGFCDLIFSVNCEKTILYPVNRHINGTTIYNWASFTNMGLSDDINEIQWGYNQYDKLVNIIFNKIHSGDNTYAKTLWKQIGF